VIRLVLFDIDGTLIRSGGAGAKAFERAFATEFNVRLSTDELKFAGRTDSSLVRECFFRHDIPATPENFRRFYDTYVFLLEHWLQEFKGEACPGARDLICGFQTMPEPPLLGLLTGNIRLGAEIKLRHFSLWDFFRSGAFGDDHEDRNELARIARERARKLMADKLAHDEILVVGDTPLDIACAHAIKAKVLAVGTGGYSCEQLRACQPTWVAETLTEVSAAELCRNLVRMRHTRATSAARSGVTGAGGKIGVPTR
jgi:phosphoglycolate phosphatase